MQERSYPYAVSRVKASEESLININLWNRLNEASEENCYQLLGDINYGSDAENKKNIDSLTQASVNAAREFINEITPNQVLTNLFLYKVDGHNIKTLLKGLLQKEDTSSILLPGGTIPIDKLESAFENDIYDEFPVKIKEAIDKFEPTMSPLVISALIDNSVFEQIIFELSNKKNQNELINHYFKIKIDLINVMTILRAYQLGWDKDQTSVLIIPGGNFNKSDLLNCLELNEEQLPDALAQGEFKDQIYDLINNFLKTKSFFKIETDFDNLAFNIIHENYMDSFGIGPIINYLLTKEFEARTLRVLFAYKRSNKEITLKELGIQ